MLNTLKKADNKSPLIIKPKKQIIEQSNIYYLFNEIYALVKRLYIQTYRRPSTLISGVILPLLWLILFSALFTNAPTNLVGLNVEYSYFLSSGIIVFTAFTGSINAGLPLMFDREFGFLNRLLIAPLISRNSLLISSVSFIATITMLQTLVILIFSLIVHNHKPTISDLLTILFITLSITLSIASISICLAFILPGHIELLAFILLTNLPTLFSSTAIAPLSFMPSWLQFLASINPLTYAIEGIRYICLSPYLPLNKYIMKTIWFNIDIYQNISILVLVNILSFILVKKIISYKYE